MASQEQNDTVFELNDDELSDTDEDLELNDDVLPPDENDDASDDHEEEEEEEDINSPATSSPNAVTVTATAAPLSKTSAAAETTIATAAVTIALPAASSAVTVAAIPIDPDPKRRRMTEIVNVNEENKQQLKLPPPPPQQPVDESRRLFQRLWTDEDEIELLRGFLDYTTSHRGIGGHHHQDTAPFYEQIKSRLQLDFNKNQLVEKLRRLKKKYRNAMNKINSGKEISFKTPHEQSTFEISRKIWSDTGKIIGFEDNVLDDDETHNHNNNNNNLNNNLNFVPLCNPNFDVKIEDGVEKKVGGNNSSSSSRSRKRSRSKLGRIEEERRVPGDGVFVVNSNAFHNENVGGGGGGGGVDRGDGGGNNIIAGVVEETVKSCLSPLLREVMNGTATMMMMGGAQCGGGRGMGMWSPMTMPPPPLPPSPLPFGLGGMIGIGGGVGGGGGGGGEVANEKWRRQQILELEVYSRRLELVQDQIRAALAELRSMGGGGGGG